MLTAFTVLACVLYLAPLATVVALQRHDRNDALDLACAMGVAFAGDFLGTFALTYFFRVERAIVVRTALLACLVAGLVLWRRVRGEPVLRARGSLAGPDLAALALAMVAGFLVSNLVSSEYWIWDREWHVPFASSL